MSLISFAAEGRSKERTLEKCIARLAKGDASAMSELYDLTSTDLYAFAFSILRNSYDAEDVLHDAYLKIYSASPSYRPEGRPMAWMVTVTKSLCLMKLRSGNRRAFMAEEDLEKIPDTPSGVTAEDKIVIEQYMKELSDEEREIVSLHAVSGLKHHEISDMLSLPAATVRSKYTRAIKKLRNIFEKEGF